MLDGITGMEDPTQTPNHSLQAALVTDRVRTRVSSDHTLRNKRALSQTTPVGLHLPVIPPLQSPSI
jgi:hypothetical protein